MRKRGLVTMEHVKRILILCSFCAIIVLTGISALNKGVPSSRLTAQKTEEGNKVRTDFVDEQGRITYAIDKHYATIIRYYKDGALVREEYYDEKGEPAKQPSGHYALAMERNEKGLNICSTYLGIDSNPIVSTNGYAKIRYVYNEKDQKELEYYCDADDNPVAHKNGYAMITRQYDDAGKVAYEYYFDADGKPVAVFSGYYGLYREYDEFGRTILSTFLDADGNPIENSNGYTTSINTYNEDGTLSTTRYYDADGNPATGGRNQYGVEYVNGQGIYLDENGERMFRLDNYLNTQPMVVMISGILLTIIAAALRGRGRTAFLFLYLAFIVLMTILYREPGTSRGAFEVFWSYKQFFSSGSMRQEILNNIWLFMPLGAVLYDLSHPHLWLLAVGLSVGIETVQYITGIGLCEIDDVISNSLGAALGCGVAMSIRAFCGKR